MSSKITQGVAAVVANLLHFGAAIGFIGYVAWEMKQKRTPQLNLLAAVAGVEFLAVIVDKLRERWSDKELKSLHGELETTKRLIPRQLSNPGKQRLKKVLSECGAAQFFVYVDEDDDEACPLAYQIGSTCPRRGGPKVVWALSPLPDAMPLPPGVGIAVGTKQDNPEWAIKINRDLSAALAADGIGLSNSPVRFNPSDPLAEGVIEITVGPRPPG